jgi:hypothetical protein
VVYVGVDGLREGFLLSAGIAFLDGAQSVWACRKLIPFPGLSYRRADDPYAQAADELKLV